MNKMKLKKRVLCRLPDCYAVSCFPIDGVPHAFFATDGYGGCVSVNLQTFHTQTVWDGPGGTMGLVPIPHSSGDFLAIQRFFPGFDAKESCIVRASRTHDGWQVEQWLEIPYLHRFDLLEQNGELYLLCCTLAQNKTAMDDWTHPGGLFGCWVDHDVTPPAQVGRIASGMTRNHGYCRVKGTGGVYAITACDEGVFAVAPPPQPGSSWRIQQLLTQSVSDVAVSHSSMENGTFPNGYLLATIEPFHGDSFCLYQFPSSQRKHVGKVWQPPFSVPFCHAIWGGMLWGKPAFLFGYREGDKRLFLVLPEESAHPLSTTGAPVGSPLCGSAVFKDIKNESCFSLQLLDEGQGPSNVCVLHQGEEEWILCANRVAGEGVLYILEP